jgi:glutamate decarboxylase
VAVLGSTFDGSYEPVKEICDALDDFQTRTGIDVPVHVDGASGAFVAPFLDPDLVWDFQLPRVASINASGHKYGLVYPGVGWIVWRDAAALPEDLIFWVNYLGDNMPTFALNFSRPGAQVVAQYYTFLRLGFAGFQRVQGYARDVATRMSSEIEKLGPFRLLTRGDELLVFAFTLNEGIQNCTVFDVSNALRERGWQVPAYTFPENEPTSPRCALSSAEASATIWPTCWSPIWSASCHASSSSRRRCTTQLREQRSATRQEKPCAAGSHTPDLHS